MNKNKKIIVIVCFVLGFIMYLSGLFLLFGSSLSKSGFFEKLMMTSTSINYMKLYGIILFMIGFLIFMVSVVILYKNSNSVESNRDLIIEGKADVITIVIMTYLMIFMLVICLIFNEFIGALLFGILIVLQSILNNVLLKIFGKRYKD